MNTEILPILTTEHHLMRSILSADDHPEDSKPQFPSNAPVSVFTIAKNYQFKEILISERYFSGFISHYKKAKKLKVKFIFSIILNVCSDLKDKSDGSPKTESKVRVWCKNSDGYKDLLKIYNFSWRPENFYYQNRLDWETLNSLITENLEVTIPFYDGFIDRNYLQNNICVPNFSKFKPIFEISECGLPFDEILKEKIQSYCQENNYELLYTQPVYYYAYEDVEAYQVFRCIANRTNLLKPELSHFTSNQFCFEEWCRKAGKKFLSYV